MMEKKYEWEFEPDYFEIELHGYPCKIRRVLKSGGHLCGYVYIPMDHKALSIDDDGNRPLIDGLYVYGGVTWTRVADDGSSFCVGFDCLGWLRKFYLCRMRT